MPIFRLTCKRCGTSRIALRLDRCTHCGKHVCVNCFTNQNGVNLCLDCHAVLTKNYQDRVLSSWNNVCPICRTWGQLQVTYFLMYRPQRTVMDPTGRVQQSQEYYGDITYTLELSCAFCGNKVNSETVGAFSAATKAEQAGRYEDAARDYERLGYLDKAKALREMGKTTIVKHQYVDINHLLDQIRQGNLVVPYRCPNCQAGIAINKDTSIDRLTNCPYCGSALVVSDIEKFLSSIL